MLSALIIDDNVHNRRIFRISLNHVGYEVAEVEDGQAGMDAFQSGNYDLIVLDLAMPVVDGVTVLKHIRQSASTKIPVVIVVTANPHMATSAVVEGADYVLQKPIDVGFFNQMLERLKHRLSG